MSSKILPPDPARQVQTVTWPAAPGSADAVEPGPAGPIDPGDPSGTMQQDCARRVAEARAAGVLEGEERVRAQAAGELQAIVDRMAQNLAEMAVLRTRLRREAEGDVVRLALAIARRVLNREMAIDPEAMHGLVLAALEKLQSQEISRARVHPDLAGILRRSLSHLSSQQAPEVIADATLEKGALLLETTRGNLDASVETQLQEIERGLADRLRRSS